MPTNTARRQSAQGSPSYKEMKKVVAIGCTYIWNHYVPVAAAWHPSPRPSPVRGEGGE